VKRIGCWILSLIDGEFLLRLMPNSGGVVVARSAWLAGVLLLLYIGVSTRLQPDATWSFSAESLRLQLAENLRLGGAIFAAAYAALYARFASQWLYLAGLYNQIMATQVREGAKLDDVGQKKLALWKAGFIEDAVAVHLATKPMYAAVIVGMLEDSVVRAAYVSSTVHGETGAANLEGRLRSAIGADAAKRLRELQSPGMSSKEARPPTGAS
jgi:hypothetical protein